MTDGGMIPIAKPSLGSEERQAVDRVLRSGMLAQGPEVAAFEEEFSDAVVGGRPTIAVNSGTSGLHLGLLAAGIGPGDEVIVPAFTFAATANAVVLTGARPVFADIDPVSFCMSVDSARAAVTRRTAAIMPVHLYGHPADMDALTRLVGDHGFALFEDAAQAHLAAWRGQPVGTFGAFAMFSLYPTKNMTSGEGGMVACDEEIRRTISLLRNQGMLRPYENEVVGFNARMTDLHAAIGRVQLSKLDGWTRQRQQNAAFLDEHLSGVVVPKVFEGATHVYHQYTIRVDSAERDRMIEALRTEHGVGCAVYYPTPLHRLESLKPYGHSADLPETIRAAGEVISLPVHPSLSRVDLERIAEGVNSAARAGS